MPSRNRLDPETLTAMLGKPVGRADSHLPVPPRAQVVHQRDDAMLRNLLRVLALAWRFSRCVVCTGPPAFTETRYTHRATGTAMQAKIPALCRVSRFASCDSASARA